MTTRTLIIVVAVGSALVLTFYLGQAWPLKALAWAEHIAGSKALAKMVVVLGAGSGMLWAGFAARRK